MEAVHVLSAVSESASCSKTGGAIAAVSRCITPAEWLRLRAWPGRHLRLCFSENEVREVGELESSGERVESGKTSLRLACTAVAGGVIWHGTLGYELDGRGVIVVHALLCFALL